MTAGGDLGGISLFDLFRTEVEQHMSALEQGLVALESGSAGREGAAVEPLMRAAHSVKGAARIVGLSEAVRLAHAMEDLLVAVQEGRARLGPEGTDALLRGTDLLKKVGALSEEAATAFFGEETATIDDLVARLRDAEAGRAASPAPVSNVSTAPPSAAPPAPVSPRPELAPAAPQAPPQAGEPSQASGGPVRVSAESLTRMLAYSGESVVQARRLAAQVDQLDGLKRTLDRLAGQMDRAVERLRRDKVSARSREALHAVRERIADARRTLTARTEAFDLASRQGADVAGRLYREVLESRLRPFGDVLGSYPRLVRDLARDLGKRARLETLGRDVPVDRDILEALDAPLNHMVRNALDHGLEPAEERAARGKDPVGLVRLAARHHAGMLEIRVTDDGRGIDLEALRAKVVERALVTEEIARILTEEELLEFLFLPGFSTAKTVTEISGRGVGLDVVQTMAREAGGTLRVERRPEGGTAFVLVLPITRSVLRVALVEIAGEPYALPLTQVERIVRVEESDIVTVESRQAFAQDGRMVGLVPASDVLGLRNAVRPTGGVVTVVVRGGRDVYGLAVDRYVGEQTLDVRALDPRLGKVANVSAVAIDDRGDPVLILDVQDLLRAVDLLLHEGRLRVVRALGTAAESQRARVKRVLVVDDSITVREVERKLLSNRGYAVDVSVDGTDAWNALLAQRYDLVLTDVDMPRMDGIELVRKIRQDPRFAALPVMIVSYKDRAEDRMRGLEAGANAYVTKSSFHEDALVREVAHLIGDARAEAEGVV